MSLIVIVLVIWLYTYTRIDVCHAWKHGLKSFPKVTSVLLSHCSDLIKEFKVTSFQGF
jgi:hypothetical protein